MRYFVIAAILVAFGAGFGAARLTLPVSAASVPMTAQVVDVGAMTYADLPALAAGAALHTKNFVTEDGATVDVQMGAAGRHLHTDADEIQYVVEGTGTEWLGDKQVALKPGLMLLIPHTTPHGGTVETDGHVKMIAIHTPPIQPGGTKPYP
ncbi:MAG TPA: cupin domain-containing protein [Candidatus Lustribacter sp.]|jgi:mannose-6-phosphate isomerase-like protein (cupin superfamily)|nr:cupin domain-containing protein [Candidatus Lustribacter sp.]